MQLIDTKSYTFSREDLHVPIRIVTRGVALVCKKTNIYIYIFFILCSTSIFASDRNCFICMFLYLSLFSIHAIYIYIYIFFFISEKNISKIKNFRIYSIYQYIYWHRDKNSCSYLKSISHRKKEFFFIHVMSIYKNQIRNMNIMKYWHNQ